MSSRLFNVTRSVGCMANSRRWIESAQNQFVVLMVLRLPCVTDEGFRYQIQGTSDEACLAATG